MVQFVCLSGLPRSGSTILSAILAQNPLIYTEGNSGVCQLIYDMNQTCNLHINEQLSANNRQHTIKDLISEIPKIYYKNISTQHNIIIDKCRAWTRTYNVELLQKYIDSNIKIIVLERSITDILKSFMKLYINNNWDDMQINLTLNALLEPNAEPIMASIAGIQMAKATNMTNTFLFIKYNDLISNPEKIIKRIYEFCGWTYYEHNFTNIVNKNQEDDNFYGLKGFHDVRPILNKEPNLSVLPPDVLNKCNEIDRLLGY